MKHDAQTFAARPPMSKEAVRTLPQLFEHRVRSSPDDEAYREFDPACNEWRCVSWALAAENVQRWKRAVAALHLLFGARVALLLPNGLNAVWADQAVMALGLVPVPMHALDNAGSIAYVVADSEASLLIVQTTQQWNDIVAVGMPLPHLKKVVVVQGDPMHAAEPGTGLEPQPLDAWLQAGTTAQPDVVVSGPAPHDFASLVYTSGTTGRPKGVMLTHENVLSNVKAVLVHVGVAPDDVFLSFLPLSHTFERTVGYYLPIAAGSCVAYARSIAQLAEDMQTVRPTVLVSVPRIYERIHGQLQQVLSTSTVKRLLFRWAETVGWRRFRARQKLGLTASDRSPWQWLDPMVWPVLRRLVAMPLMDQFGGRLRAAVSGGAPLSPAIARCFLGLGVPLLQGYGMTETSPVVAANRLDSNDPATVGEVLCGVQVRLGERQELQVFGPNVMQGYWKRPEETAKVIMADGWLRTGDQASIENGRVRILGRIKEIIVMSTGEKIAPADVELAILADPLFEQAFVVGDNRPYIAAVVTMNAARWATLAAEIGLDASDPASLDAPAARKAALHRIEQVTGHLPRTGVPKAVTLTLTPWTVENLLLTPTLKLKRHSLQAHFADEIERMYHRPGTSG